MRSVLAQLDYLRHDREVIRNSVGNLLLVDGDEPVGFIDVLYPDESDLTAYAETG
jgi:hypothetical protein